MVYWTSPKLLFDYEITVSICFKKTYIFKCKKDYIKFWHNSIKFSLWLDWASIRFFFHKIPFNNMTPDKALPRSDRIKYEHSFIFVFERIYFKVLDFQIWAFYQQFYPNQIWDNDVTESTNRAQKLLTKFFWLKFFTFHKHKAFHCLDSVILYHFQSHLFLYTSFWFVTILFEFFWVHLYHLNIISNIFQLCFHIYIHFWSSF